MSNKYPYLNTNLPLIERINDLISRMTLEEKIKLLPTHEAAIPHLNINEYNVGGEACHGIVCSDINTTVFPQPIGLSCSFDEKLLKEIGTAISTEARIIYDLTGKNYGLTRWAPTIDMERDPRWGRTEEAYGEDPCLTGKLSANLIKGMQGDDDFYLKLVAAPKHFYCNNHEENRIIDSSNIDDRNKYEYYLKAFKPAFTEGHAYSMMTAYNEINGVPCIVNKEVQSIVKDLWGCDGFIVCDGGDFSQTVTHHKYYKTHAETIANAILSGVDSFTDEPELVMDAAKEAVNRNLITEDDINTAIKNILKVRFKLGEFDDESLNPYSNIPKEKLCSMEHNKLALKAAKESIVLLKNTGILPLSKSKLKSVSIIGPLSDVVYRDWYAGFPPYKITALKALKNSLPDVKINHVNGFDEVTLTCKSNNKYLSVNLNDYDNIYFSESDKNATFYHEDWGFNSHAFKSKVNNKYLYSNDDEGFISATSKDVFGWFVKEIFKLSSYNFSTNEFNLKTWNDNYVFMDNSLKINNSNLNNDAYRFTINKTKDGIKEATLAAKNSDVAIVFVGNNPMVNGKEEVDRKDIILPEKQSELIKAVYNANPNTIVVIIGSYPFAINYEQENIPAILYTSHGCQELGNALSEVLLGEYSPCGKLSMTWYKSISDLPPINDYDIINGKRTYMYFDKDPLYAFGHGLSYTTFEYSNLNINIEDKINISFNVKNTGNTISDEVVQLYVHAENSKVKRPIKELKDFKRININPSESKTINFTLSTSDLSYYDTDEKRFLTENGKYTFMIGASSDDIRLKETIYI